MKILYLWFILISKLLTYFLFQSQEKWHWSCYLELLKCWTCLYANFFVWKDDTSTSFMNFNHACYTISTCHIIMCHTGAIHEDISWTFLTQCVHLDQFFSNSFYFTLLHTNVCWQRIIRLKHVNLSFHVKTWQHLFKYHDVFCAISPSGCTFWGKKPWSRKKKILWQLGTLVGAPVGISLIAGVAVPAIIIGVPIWVGRKVSHLKFPQFCCSLLMHNYLF